MNIHAHLWSADSSEFEEFDFGHTGTYDDHLQFSGSIIVDGTPKHLELRLFFKDLPEMLSTEQSFREYMSEK